jgi:hypothetical protein
MRLVGAAVKSRFTASRRRARQSRLGPHRLARARGGPSPSRLALHDRRPVTESSCQLLSKPRSVGVSAVRRPTHTPSEELRHPGSFSLAASQEESSPSVLVVSPGCIAIEWHLAGARVNPRLSGAPAATATLPMQNSAFLPATHVPLHLLELLSQEWALIHDESITRTMRKGPYLEAGELHFSTYGTFSACDLPCTAANDNQ